jgi:2-amino-4-hydroxy-6-hydroxymethyldihydropteridine diphosphokinase
MKQISRKDVFLGLGSNLNDRHAYLENAISQLDANKNIQVRTRSSILETDPIGKIPQPKYLNMVVEIETCLSPKELLNVCLEIEADNGRVRTEKWGPRTLDIDILFYGDEVVDTHGLKIPHPELAQRRFVLEPMAEIAPDFKHPKSKDSILAMLQRL